MPKRKLTYWMRCWAVAVSPVFGIFQASRRLQELDRTLTMEMMKRETLRMIVERMAESPPPKPTSRSRVNH